MSAELQLKAARRLLALREARTSLLGFLRLTMPDPADIDDPTLSRYQITPLARLLCEIMEKVARGEMKRVAVSVGPQMGKSQVLSRAFPAWYAGQNPYANLILGTYNQPFADEFGDAVREIMGSNVFAQTFPATRLRKGGKAKDLLITENNGRMAFVGRGGSGTGKPADIFIVDDPLKDDTEAQSDTTREETWKWFNKVAFTRCHDDSRIVVVHCLTGDTPVTMADGSRRALRDVRPGDKVLAYEGGQFASREVLNFASQGEDDVFEVRTGSSRVRANARHPFLVFRHGQAQWVKCGDLNVGDHVVTSAVEPGNDPARVSEQEAWLLGFMFGDGWLTYRDAFNICKATGAKWRRRGIVTCAAFSKHEHENAKVEQAFARIFGFVPKRTRYGYWRTEVQAVGRWFEGLGLAGKAKTKRVPHWMFGQPPAIKEAFIQGMNHADGTVDAKRQSNIATANRELVDDMRHLARASGHCVSNVHEWSGRVQPPHSKTPIDTTIYSFKWGLRRVSEAFHAKPITRIEPAGRAEVFDIQVEGAESFIADGLVVHNTRWHGDDLIGRLCDPDHPERNKAYAGIAEDWTYINLPAVVTDPGLAKALGLTLEVPTEPKVVQAFGARPMTSIWPGRKSLPLLAEAKRMDERGFNALYMGRPTPDDGEYFKTADLVEYEADELPDNLRIYGASDHAVSEKQDRDYTVLGCVGVDEKDQIWVLPDVVWDRMETDRTVEEMLHQFRTHSPLLWWMEDELISKSFGPFLRKRMMEENVYTAIDTVRPAKDKKTRARSIQGRMQMRKVRFPKFAPWWPEARKQILRFPYGANDDFVDWLAHIGMGLTKEVAASRVTIANDNAQTGSIRWVLQQTANQARKKTTLDRGGW